MKKLSVVITIYNEAHLLPEILDMQFKQTRQADEIIITDDCSSDNSFELAKELTRGKSHIQVRRNERNLGVIANMNVCLEMVTGDYISYPSDNLLFPKFYENSLDVLKRYPQAAFSFSDHNRFEDGLLHEAHFKAQKEYLSPDDLILLGRKYHQFPPHASWSIVARKDLLKRYNPLLKWNTDFFLFNTLALRHGACYVPGTLSANRIIKTSYSSMKGPILKRRGVYQEILRLLKTEEFKDVRPLFKKAKALDHYGLPVLAALVTRPNNLDFLSLTLLNHCFRTSCIKPIESFIKKCHSEKGN